MASRLRPVALGALLAGLASAAGAQSLSPLYEAARQHDAAFQSARAQYDAAQYRAEQARAGLLPQVGLQAAANQNAFENSLAGVSRSFGQQSAAVSASQPIYRPANAATYEQGLRQAELARFQLQAAEQDLIVRTSQAYFDVLAAQDTLAFVRAQKTAVNEQLASAKRNFEVGTATITDSREAQARFDLVTAQEIAAENDLRVKRLALENLVGRSGVQPQPLATLPVAQPVPADPEAWVRQSEDASPAIQQARKALEVAKLETDKARAGHLPTLDLTGSYSHQRNPSGTTLTSIPARTNLTTFGLTFNLPLFAGFATQNRIRETLALEERAQADLDNARRTVAQATRAAYFGVVSGTGQVSALEAAESSSQLALDANRLGYQVGVRINIDVLNSQSQLFQTKRDLAVARYNVLMGQLKLRQANGTLTAQDVAALDALLAR